ncbi:MAG: hypothetical protein AVDCRST_MAG07-1439 [uncultured Frankineae bacterium]|uniref:histidine kinase n=1 Tax=uncultured Frankineae bacterium TaxID=437475 RepID=A0A6J4L584_9ACTN|nr:MAG: hypothetical protein AVDCRST_MAG07-1439 [uncultured Frankineae bacterium]
MAAAGMPRSRTSSGPVVRDGLLVLGVAALGTWGLHGGADATAAVTGSLDHPAHVVVLLLGAGALSVVWGRRAPVAVLAAIGLALVGHELVAVVRAPVQLVVLIALCALAGACPPRFSARAALALAATVAVGALVLEGLEHELPDVALLTVVAWTLGSCSRRARDRSLALARDGELLRREHESRTALALEQERARIARELHDVVAHHVCMIVAQARAGQVVLDQDPETVREALRSMEGTGREALTELRRMLDLLRPTPEEPAGWPQPGLDQLPALVGSLVGAGLPVGLQVAGTPRRLSPGIELAAYRIVQESLTNALRHGERTGTSVRLTFDEDVLAVRVEDAGTGAPPAGAPGRGLVGMRQRAELVGGSLQAGPAAEGGFLVCARLPTDRAA